MIVTRKFKAGDKAHYMGSKQPELVGCTVQVTGYVHDLVEVAHRGTSRLVNERNLIPYPPITSAPTALRGEHICTACGTRNNDHVTSCPNYSGRKEDAVNSPKHYQFFPDLEAIEVIARSMTREQFYGYCLGNRLKYRLRAGNKDKLEQDIAKSDKYSELYEQHRGKCIDAK